MIRHRTPWYRSTRRRKPVRQARIAPIQARSILTPAELAFFRVLSRALPAQAALSLKTRLADIVHCPNALWHEPFGRRVAQKHVDFTVYDPATGKILAVIELDDRSHDSPARRRRDQFLDQVLEYVGIPLVRVRCASCYHVHILSAILSHVIDESTDARQPPSKPPPGMR